MTEVEQRFFDRATQSLFNPSEVTEPIAKQALNEAREELDGRVLPEHRVLDIAMMRLKILLKADIDDTDEMLYKTALKSAQHVDAESNPVTIIETATKESVWDM